MGFLTGTSGSDTLTGRPNEDDQVYGFDGDDTLSGDSGADFLHGGNGNDVLIGGLGGDALFGGAGADTFVYLTAADSSQTGGIDTLIDFETGIDRIDLRALSVTGASILQRQDGGSYVFATLNTGQVVTVVSNRTVSASDLLLSQPIGVHVSGSATSETLIGTSRADSLYGGLGNDTLVGGLGDDILYGGVGADILSGGADNDIFLYLSAGESNATTGYDNIVAFESNRDRIDFSALPVSQVSISYYDDESTIVRATVGTDDITLLSGLTIHLSDLILGSSPINGVYGFGSNRSNVIRGWSGTDYLYGFDGNDGLHGNDGNDYLYGGAGNDTLYGGRGDDVMDGGTGRNTYSWSSFDGPMVSSDRIVSFVTGEDTLNFRYLFSKSITLTRTADGTQIILLGDTNLSLNLNAFVNGQDLSFDFDPPRFITLVDQSGNSTLIGGDLNEIIVGGSGFDNLTGGGGRDTFRYDSPTDSQGLFADFINDFTSGQDLIDLRPLGANIVVNLGFVSGQANVFVDVNADGINDMLIRLTGVTALTPNDFLFTGRFGSQPAASPAEAYASPTSDDAMSLGATGSDATGSGPTGVDATGTDMFAHAVHATHGDWMMLA